MSAPQFAANLSMLFTEVEFLDRFAEASRAGFRAVECQFPYAWPADALVERLDRFGLVQVLHNLPAGNWAAGERGIACLPDRVGEFQDGVGRAISYATALRCTRVNCLAGIVPEGADRETLCATFVENVRFAARQLKEAGIRLLIEPLNTHDTPGFLLATARQAVDVIEQAGSDNLSLQLDIYHAHLMEGDAVAAVQQSARHISHVQIADAPGRHEPGTGSIDFARVFHALECAGYTGWTGCEYVPATTTRDGLKWLNAYGSFPASAS